MKIQIRMYSARSRYRYRSRYRLLHSLQLPIAIAILIATGSVVVLYLLSGERRTLYFGELPRRLVKVMLTTFPSGRLLAPVSLKYRIEVANPNF